MADDNSILYVVALLAAVNVFTSFQVIRSDYYTAAQKFAQCVMVWLIPVLGALLIWSFLRTQVGWKKYDTRAYPERSEKMVSVVLFDAVRGDASHTSSDSGSTGND